jgi:hypothetical protein
MRTTVTLDPDVERLLKGKARESRQSFKQVLNNAVRQSLGGTPRGARGAAFKVKARPMGLRVGLDPARLAEYADDHELQAFLDVTRRLRRRASR